MEKFDYASSNVRKKSYDIMKEFVGADTRRIRKESEENKILFEKLLSLIV